MPSVTMVVLKRRSDCPCTWNSLVPFERIEREALRRLPCVQYADTWYGNGTVSLPTSGYEGYRASTWQPVWDSWMRMIEVNLLKLSLPLA